MSQGCLLLFNVQYVGLLATTHEFTKRNVEKKKILLPFHAFCLELEEKIRWLQLYYDPHTFCVVKYNIVYQVFFCWGLIWPLACKFRRFAGSPVTVTQYFYPALVSRIEL